MNWPASRAGRSAVDQSHVAGGATGTSVGGSATGALASLPAPRVVRRLAGLPAGVAEAERRLRVELLEAAAALRVDMAGLKLRGETSLVFANSALNALKRFLNACDCAGQCARYDFASLILSSESRWIRV